MSSHSRWCLNPATILCGSVAFALIATSAAAVEPESVGPVYKKMFITSTSGTGALAGWDENTTPPSGLTGLAAGDKICQVRAEAAGLDNGGSSVFRAWLADGGTDAYCHVQGLTGTRYGDACGGATQIGGGPWVRVDGIQFSLDLDRLVADYAIHEPLIDETGATISPLDHSPWAGSQTSHTCNSWLSESSGDQGQTGRAYNVGWWTDTTSSGCDVARKLYCFEQGPGPAPPTPGENAALVFVTDKTGPGDLSNAAWLPESEGLSGLAAADAVCRNSAAAARLPNPSSFVAWLSTSTVDASDHVAGNGPWKALDGFPIASSKADLTDGSIATAVRWTERSVSLSYVSYWTGSNPVGDYTGSPGNTCLDWTSTSTSYMGTEGSAGESDLYWTTGYGLRCDFSDHLLCISDTPVLGWDNFEFADLRRWQVVVP